MTLASHPSAPGLDAGSRVDISDCFFVDLYASNIPSDIPVARSFGLVKGSRNPGLRDIPEEARDSARELVALVDAHFLKTGETEFVLQRGDVFYRSALIAAPAARQTSGPQARRDWCLRRIGSNIPDIAAIGIPDAIRKSLRDAGRDRGLVIVAGPFGSGKSTTASAALVDWVTTNRESGVTLEDPPEFPIGGRYPEGGIIHQVHVTHSTLSGSIVNSRRWAPRYIFLGEIRTPESAAELLHMSISGPLTLCTIHASDPIQAIASLIRFAGSHIGDLEARRIVAASLRLVVHQDLSWGHMISRKIAFPAKGAEPMRAKIELGKLNMLQEDLERQEKLL